MARQRFSLIVAGPVGRRAAVRQRGYQAAGGNAERALGHRRDRPALSGSSNSVYLSMGKPQINNGVTNVFRLLGPVCGACRLAFTTGNLRGALAAIVLSQLWRGGRPRSISRSSNSLMKHEEPRCLLSPPLALGLLLGLGVLHTSLPRARRCGHFSRYSKGTFHVGAQARQSFGGTDPWPRRATT